MGSTSNFHTGHQIDNETYQETAMVICPYILKEQHDHSLSMDDQAEEAVGLTKALDLEVVHTEIVKIARISPSALIGKGKVDEISKMAKEFEPDVIIVNHSLSPVQQRNLEKKWHSKVIDRTGLILEIFGERAQTSEGKIQVELAALDYQRSRLVRSWTHLERQRGGAGFMGGPGETQIEIDRRLIADRIARLKKDLEQIKKGRDLQKRSRAKVPFPVVSLVGYTNAGKSTLFNTITDADVMAEDLLFATLDPTMRKVDLEDGSEIILSDTVGFIADLPTNLIAAFRATLEHVQDAHIILHVIDVSQEHYEFQRDNVIDILQDLDVDYETDERIIEVYNKIDNLEEDERARLLKRAEYHDNMVCVSALEDIGIDELLLSIAGKLAHDKQIIIVTIPYSDGKATAWVHEHSYVLECVDKENGREFKIQIDDANLGRFTDQFSYKIVHSD